jgi:hypothetical protein
LLSKPNCPNSLLPQAIISFSLVIAKECKSPQLIFKKFKFLFKCENLTSTGNNLSVVVLSPICPYLLLPNEKILLFSIKISE